MKHEKTFLGIGWKFPPTFDPKTASVEMVSGERDIKESLRILLSTKPGERTMLPEYGCDMHFLILETIDSTLISQMKKKIEAAILYFESRITIEEININTDQSLDGLLWVYLTYTINKTNTRSNMVYPFYFIEGSEARYAPKSEEADQ